MSLFLSGLSLPLRYIKSLLMYPPDFDSPKVFPSFNLEVLSLMFEINYTVLFSVTQTPHIFTFFMVLRISTPFYVIDKPKASLITLSELVIIHLWSTFAFPTRAFASVRTEVGSALFPTQNV